MMEKQWVKRLIIYKFDKFTWLNTLLFSRELDQKSFTTPMKVIFSQHKSWSIPLICLYMIVVQLLHITKRILDYAHCQTKKGLFQVIFPKKVTRKFLTPMQSPHRRLFLSAVIQVFLLSLLTTILQIHVPLINSVPTATFTYVYFKNVYSKFCFHYKSSTCCKRKRAGETDMS